MQQLKVEDESYLLSPDTTSATSSSGEEVKSWASTNMFKCFLRKMPDPAAWETLARMGQSKSAYTTKICWERLPNNYVCSYRDVPRKSRLSLERAPGFQFSKLSPRHWDSLPPIRQHLPCSLGWGIQECSELGQSTSSTLHNGWCSRFACVIGAHLWLDTIQIPGCQFAPPTVWPCGICTEKAGTTTTS